MEEKSWIIVSEDEDNGKFATIRECEKWESKFMTR